MSTAASSWYQDEAALLEELRRSGEARGAPAVPGYDGLVEIARGGQGVVYAATQRSTRRAVAIKVLIDGGWASAAARRRFEREIDVVASLRHPGIVAVYDSGVTADGRPYLVMEHVEGRPFDVAVGAPAADLRSAASAVASVCEAVQHAHQRGVIHRDLKPSNVRVDGEGRPRVLDFGLAKAAGDGAVGPTVSVTGQFMGSLPWASPEQALGEPDAVDVRSDVYALGVMLYQVVTGRFPYDVTGGLKTVLDRIASEPPAPARGLRAGVDEDLATILGKALAKEPGRRYQSAGELGADLRRWLAREPILARADSAWYTVSRTLQRHRLAAGAGVVVLAATAGALVVSLRALSAARAERDRAEAQSVEARAQASRARAVAQVVRDVLLAANPGVNAREMKVIDALGPARATVGDTLRDQPEALVAVRATLSAAYRNLQAFDDAAEQARLGLEVAEARLAGPGRETASARTAYAAALTDLGRPAEALEHAARAMADAERVGGDSPEMIEAMQAYATALDELRRTDEAEKVKRDAAERAARVFGPDSAEALGALGNLGRTLYERGELREAVAILEGVVERSRRSLGPAHVATLSPISTLVASYQQLGQKEKAEPLAKEAWESISRAYGPASASALTYANNYAVLLHNTGRSAEALPIAESVVEGFTKLFGEEHQSVLRSMTLLGSVYGGVGRNDDQIRVQGRALELAERSLGVSSPAWVYILNNYAQSLGTAGRYAEAEAQLTRAVPVVDGVFGEKHSMPATIWYNLAVTKVKGGRPAGEARALFERAVERFLATLGPASDWTKDAVDELAKLLESQGEPAEAARWRERLKSASGG